MTIKKEDLLEYITLREKYLDALTNIRALTPEIFRQVRIEKVWTQRELAEKLGCQHTFISRVEHGNAFPGFKIFNKIIELW